MTTNIRAWGNSQGLYIPKKVLKDAGLSINDSVELAVVEGAIMIRKSSNLSVKEKAWTSLQELRSSHNHVDSTVSADYKKEIGEYLDEKYGK